MKTLLIQLINCLTLLMQLINCLTFILQATKRGIHFKKEEFGIFADALEQEVVNKWRGLREMRPCHLSHSSSEQEIQCNHCHPKFLSPEEKASQREARIAKAREARAAREARGDSGTTEEVQPSTSTSKASLGGEGSDLPLKKRKIASCDEGTDSTKKKYIISSDSEDDDDVFVLPQKKLKKRI